MPVNPVAEQIKLYPKHLRIPTFSSHQEILRTMSPSEQFKNILLELMKIVSLQRHENQNKRRLKAAAFPYHKVLDDLD